MKMLIAFAWALPKFDSICIAPIEELTKLWLDEIGLFLEHVRGWIKDFLSNVNRVCNYDDSRGIMWEDSMVDTASYGKEFGFLSSNVNSMVESFNYRFVENMNVRNEQSNIVFDTHVSYHESIAWGGGGINC